MNGLNFLNFFSRYLCGDIAMREASKITWKQIKLNSLFKETSSLTEKLNNSKLSYEKAVIKASTIGKVDLYLLKMLNRNLNNHRSGIVRDCHITAGGTLLKPMYIAPSPDKVINLISQLLDDIEKLSGFEKKFYLYSQIINIHPFYDGNGRTARAIFDSTYIEGGEFLNPYFIYHIFGESKRHFLTTHSKRVFTSRTYRDDLAYVESSFNSIIETIREKRLRIEEELTPSYNMHEIDFFFNRPLFDEGELICLLKSRERAIDFLNINLNSKNLKIKKYNVKSGEKLFFEFKCTMNFYNEAEAILFNRKGS
ncbi:hypothetical protein HG263_06200 [Pseudoalteromonas sp. JBTF-M23]|uniref:Fido domain-containing protein n=1 Tax=Pseudoalteromonas caenipelagi TaxID=2726988 RepID=A0A849VEJ9_9GAMM|nr:Fic family protein [Pseudoalteromonas caenipelagi]NOU50131.1 hypothetical protein [Pseudoalteromonas caenipelagi]